MTTGTSSNSDGHRRRPGNVPACRATTPQHDGVLTLSATYAELHGKRATARIVIGPAG